MINFESLVSSQIQPLHYSYSLVRRVAASVAVMGTSSAVIGLRCASFREGQTQQGCGKYDGSRVLGLLNTADGALQACSCKYVACWSACVTNRADDTMSDDEARLTERAYRQLTTPRNDNLEIAVKAPKWTVKSGMFCASLAKTQIVMLWTVFEARVTR